MPKGDRMLSKYYDQMIENTNEQLCLFRDLLIGISRAKVNEAKVIANVQEQIISFGNNLETEYALWDSPVIHLFENIAELLFSLIDDPSDKSFDTLFEYANSLEDSLRNSKEKKDIRMALVLIIKNEARYVREWIEFHNMLGVEHFYIYDNESTDNLSEVLRPYVEKGLVTLQSWPGKIAQLPSYNHALSYYKMDCEYMGFIDTDEFLFPIEGMSLPDTIDKVFYDYEHQIAHPLKAGGVGVNWRTYGTSHIAEPVEGLVIENFKLRGYDNYSGNIHIKSIVKPMLVKCFLSNPHSVVYNDSDTFTISEHGSMIPLAFFYDGHCDILRINHYYSRSEKDLYIKMNVRGWADLTEETEKEYAAGYNERLQACNDIRDDIMDRFIEPLKRRMGE